MKGKKVKVEWSFALFIGWCGYKLSEIRVSSE